MKLFFILLFTVVAPIWIVFYFIFGRRPRVHERRSRRRSQQLQASQQQMSEIENKVRAIERYVTSSSYQLNKEINKL